MMASTPLIVPAKFSEPFEQIVRSIWEADTATRRKCLTILADFLTELSHLEVIDLPALLQRLFAQRRRDRPAAYSNDAQSNTSSYIHKQHRVQKHSSRRKRRRISSEGLGQDTASQTRSLSISNVTCQSNDEDGTYIVQLWRAEIQLTSDRTCEDLTAAAAEFGQRLAELRFDERKNNKPVKTALMPDDVKTLVHFFFHDVFGLGCRERIYTLIDELGNEDKQGDELGSGVLASQRAIDTTLIPEVRAFFTKYSCWHKGEIDHSKIYPVILQTIRAYELYVSFVTLREMTSGDSGSQLRKFLADQGFCQSRGVDIRTCILRYLCRELNMTPTQLNNTLQAQLGIYSLVQEFGMGILVLLPKVASYRINRLGNQKMRKIIKVLSLTLPEATQLCREAELSILKPITSGQKLPRLLSHQPWSRRTMSMLEAVTPITISKVYNLSTDGEVLVQNDGEDVSAESAEESPI